MLKELALNAAKPVVDLGPSTPTVPTDWTKRIERIKELAIEAAKCRLYEGQDHVKPTRVEVISPGYMTADGHVPVKVKLSYGEIDIYAGRHLSCATSTNIATWDFTYKDEPFDDLESLGNLINRLDKPWPEDNNDV